MSTSPTPDEESAFDKAKDFNYGPQRPYTTPSLREQMDKCKHFTGLGCDKNGDMIPLGVDRKDKERSGSDGRGQCRAEVYYDNVRKQGRRMIALPCFRPEPDNMPIDGIWPTCPKCEFKTPQELDQEEAELKQHLKESLERISIIRPAILKHAKWPANISTYPIKRKSAGGSFPCPVCKKGTIHYTISNYNGHVHCVCRPIDPTEHKCANWME